MRQGKLIVLNASRRLHDRGTKVLLKALPTLLRREINLRRGELSSVVRAKEYHPTAWVVYQVRVLPLSHVLQPLTNVELARCIPRKRPPIRRRVELLQAVDSVPRLAFKNDAHRSPPTRSYRPRGALRHRE